MSNDVLNKIMEAAIDIALTAGAMIESDEISVDNSRDLTTNIAVWAKEFEESGYDEEDYISEVDKFAVEKLKEEYPLGKERKRFV